MRFQYIITRLSLIIMFNVIIGSANGQRQADRWYFGIQSGLNFNSGEPATLNDGHVFYLGECGIGTMSDSLGNLLFYSDSDTIFTSQHNPMENGIGFFNSFGTQSNLIVPWPESDSLYLVFKLPNHGNNGSGLRYSVIDISKNNGLGSVIEKDRLLDYAWDAASKVTATLHRNKRDIWIITRKFRENSFASFLLTQEGINEIPILSPVPNQGSNDGGRGFIKFSYDKKYLFSNYWDSRNVEVCLFNDETGEIDFQYELNTGRNPDGIEFSPDSKFAYISYQGGTSTPVTIIQYNMNFVDDVSLFITTSIEIVNDAINGYALQLATDGKIYCLFDGNYTSSQSYMVGVISKPWLLGADCEYNLAEVNMFPSLMTYSLPNIMMDYLYRFEFEGLCAGTPFQFSSNFNPIPDSIRWLFNDPESGLNNISNELNPEHSFTYGGIYEVEVDVWYPSGRFEHTSREVEVAYAPLPNLGSDTLVCDGESVTLIAGSDPGMYVWSTGALGQNLFSITVSDTGIYSVTASSSEGCSRTDSIHVGWFNKAIFNEATLVISATSCGGNNGSIVGLQVEGASPFNYTWYDGNNNPIGLNLNIVGLSVGNYYLHVVDSNDCVTISSAYTVIDGGNILITAIDSSAANCLQNNGYISITASSGTGSNFDYSIDNGITWQSSSLFENLVAGNYTVRVKDQNDCETAYSNNPVIIENIDGPQVNATVATDETDYTGDGSILIEAIVGSGMIQYSIDSGNTFQTNNGLFENLSAETYYCVAQDEFGCDTTFIIEIERIISQIIDAIAGDGYTCIGNATASSLMLSNFNNVFGFDVILSYNQDLITCDGYIQVNPDLEAGFQVTVIPAQGEIHITWQGQSSVSLPDNSLMAKLVFRGVDEGLSQVDWIAEQGQSQFFNENGDVINADFELGFVIIYSRPDITFSPSTENLCEGDMLLITPQVSGGTGEYNSIWMGPDDFTSNNNGIWIDEVSSNMAGTYTLTVTDTINCVESKSIEVIVNQGTNIAFADYDTLWVEPGYILEAGYGAEYYIWNTGDDTESIIIDSIGNYDVELISYQGCKSSDTVQILWGGAPFYLPNAFTPNGDGLNDKFIAVQKYDYVNLFHMIIYNRWGQLIFATNDINKGWDGTYKGTVCQSGSYVFKVTYNTSSQGISPSETKMGTVMLVR